MPKNDILKSEWNIRDTPYSWFRKLDVGARKIGVYKPFVSWVNQSSKDIRSVIEVGGGACIFLSRLFSDIEFVGYDISKQATDWCNEHNMNSKHRYILGDFEEYKLEQKFDLVFSIACIDHVHNVDKFLESCVRASKKFIYIISYRGYFPELKEHVTEISRTGIHFHNLSVCRIKDTLSSLGVNQVRCFPIPVDRPDYRPEDLGIYAYVGKSKKG